MVLTREQANQAGLSHEFVAAWITLPVHSSLTGIGLTAAVSSPLSDAGLSRSVSWLSPRPPARPPDRTEDAMGILRGLSHRQGWFVPTV